MPAVPTFLLDLRFCDLELELELTRFGGAFQAFDGGSIDAEDTICLRP